MTPDEHKLAAGLFDRIRDLPEGERAAALERECAGNRELHARILLLLEADRQAEAEAFLGGEAIADAARMHSLHMREPLASGVVIGNYRLGPKIGAGGMGEVYEGQDSRLGRRVAIKILPVPFAEPGEDRVKRFQRESRAASLLNHPNIVSIFEADFDRGYYYIAAEFIEGKTLRQLIPPASARLDSQTILDLVGQAAAGLQAAHEAGIVHRDIKPENIMVRPDGLVKVLDFGLAKLLEGPASEPGEFFEFRSRPGLLAGTIQYLAPEQVAGKPVDARSDLFSLGVVAYELTTGARPFDGPTDGAIYDAILNRVPHAPSELRPGIGPELDNLILRAIEKNPGLRFQTAADLRSACKRLSRDSSPLELSSAPRIERRRWFDAKLVAAVGLLVIGVLASWYWSTASIQPVQSLPVQFQRMTDLTGEEASPSLSADGKQFVYASALSGNWDIYLQRTGGATPINLTGATPDEDTHPALSPDGARIVFRSERDGGGLFVMESTGEDPRRISHRGYLPAWAPDNRHIVYSIDTFTIPGARGLPVSRLFIVDLAGGTERTLETGDAIQPNWSPHGDRIAYWGVSGGGRRDIFTVAASGNGAPVPVTADDATDWCPVWSPAGDHLYFLSNRGGTMNVWRVAVDERSGRVRGTPEPVTVPARYVGALSFSRNGNALLYSSASQRNSLARIPLDPVTHAAAGPLQPVASEQAPSNLAFSPDGMRIVFDTLGEPSEEIWIMNSDGTGRRRLLSDRWRNRAPKWSPDGKEILFLSDRSGEYGNWVIREDGSGLRPLTTVADPNMQSAVWSPDGSQVLAARSPDPPVILDPRAARPVVHPATAPGLDGAGALMFNDWTDGPDGNLAIGQTTPTTPQSDIVLYSFQQARLESAGLKGRFAYWLRLRDPGERLRWFVFARSTELLLFDRKLRREKGLFSAADPIYALAVSPDGRWVYFTRTIRDADLWLSRWPGR